MSKLMSLGNRCNVDFLRVLPYLVEHDEATTVIALYMKASMSQESFLAAKSLRGRKPIIAYKAGKSERR